MRGCAAGACRRTCDDADCSGDCTMADACRAGARRRAGGWKSCAIARNDGGCWRRRCARSTARSSPRSPSSPPAAPRRCSSPRRATCSPALAALALLAARGELRWLVERAARLASAGDRGAGHRRGASAASTSAPAARRRSSPRSACRSSRPTRCCSPWLVLGHRPTPRRVLGDRRAARRHRARRRRQRHRDLARRLVPARHAALLAGRRTWWCCAAWSACRRSCSPAPATSTAALLLAVLWLVVEGPAALPAPATLLVAGAAAGAAGAACSATAARCSGISAIARIDLARATAIVVPSIPLLSLAASFVLLGEVATRAQWAGMGLTAAGMLVFVTR